MTKVYKVCPICDARNHRNAALCATCGTTIVEVAPHEQSREDDFGAERYDYRLGETDLAEESLIPIGRVLSAFMILIVVLIVAGVAWTALGPRLPEGSSAHAAIERTAAPTRMAGPSVTPGSPTATYTASPPPTAAPTDTETPAPCVRKVAAGDSLIGIISRCGHRSLEILPTVMALNGIVDETRIQVGQEIIVPLPSPTPDPAATPPLTAEGDVDSASAADDSRSAGLALVAAVDPFAPTATPTLLPGLMWHVVQPEENMIVIAVQYETNAKSLSDLNPEIEFYLCDFGLAYGGPECTVQLRQGQKIRVPAPTPTMTPIPTASGSETPTPLPTATFNAPLAISPPDQAFFTAFEQVTLRWVTTGRLADNEVYRIHVTDTDTGATFSADTSELFYIIPDEWQAQDADSHHYSWHVSVSDIDTNDVSLSTAVRTFVWQGVG